MPGFVDTPSATGSPERVREGGCQGPHWAGTVPALEETTRMFKIDLGILDHPNTHTDAIHKRPTVKL